MADEQLAERAQRGDRAAGRLLVERHLPLVRRLAARYRNLGLPYDDLVQEGSIGLLDAVDRFDRTRGAAFPTFAYWCIRRSLTHALTQRGHLVRLPKRLIERRTSVAAAARRLGCRNGREPSIQEIAEEMGLAAAEVRGVIEAPISIASLDEPVAKAGAPLGSLVVDESACDPAEEAVAHELRDIVTAAVAELPENEQTVVRRHFGLDGAAEPLNDIATACGVSPQKTRAIKDRALFHLARSLRPPTGAARSTARRTSTRALQIGPLVALLVSKVAALLEHADLPPL